MQSKRFFFISLLVICFFYSCRKQSQTTVNFHLYNPVTGIGYSDISVRIRKHHNYEREIIWEGKTDVNGRASYTFKAIKSDKYTYWQVIDPGFYKDNKIVKEPERAPINKNKQNDIEYQILSY